MVLLFAGQLQLAGCLWLIYNMNRTGRPRAVEGIMLGAQILNDVH